MIKKLNTFEVGVYNKYVRVAVREGNNLPTGLDARWEETYLYEIQATSAKNAEEIMLQEYPTVLGYVIDGVIQLTHD
jgi:hypothetical protein|tara:strand:+ start:967 stop:1197 length:231 start_codon:yes stop_codon:yes gene_type:complete